MTEVERGGVKSDTPTPETNPPPISTPNSRDIFSKQKGLMDYINWKDIQRKTGITKETAYTFIEKEVTDNAVDYVETHHDELVDGYPSVQVKILPYHSSSRKYLRLVVINTNDGTPSFNEDLIRSIFDPKSKVSSKRNQFKVNRGALGDALKEVLGIPYALFHEYDSESQQQQEWNEPLIIRNNSANEEFHIRLIIDRVNQDIGLDVQRKINTVVHGRHATSPNTTEIEIRLPVFEENENNDDDDNESGDGGDWSDLTLKQSVANTVLYSYSYSLFITHIDFTTEWRNAGTDERFSNYSRRYQQIEKGWTNKTSVYFYTLSQFQEFILELAEEKQSIYDVLYKVFREGSNIPKTSVTQMRVGQLKKSPVDMKDLYNLLRQMPAPSSLSLPFNVKNKSTRAQALKGRVMSIYGGILDVKYKSDFGVVKSDNGKVQIPFFFEIAVMRLKRDDKNLIFEQAINSSTALGDSIVFSGKEFYFFPPGSKFKHPARSIYNIFEYYGYSHDKEKAKKKHSLILVNLVSPKLDYQSYGKSRIDYMPFINQIEELTVKACQGGGGRAIDGKSSRISVVRKILEDRQEKWYSWDSTTRQSHWWTMSDVFYAARKKLVEEEGYEVEEIDRKTITGYIKDICDKELKVRREDIGIIAADRAQMYFNGQWMDVGFNEIRELSLYGTDLIIIEKEGMVIQLKEFADEYGIALLNPRGFLVEYATVLSEKSEKGGCNISILTDLDVSGLLLARDVPNAFRIGIDFDTLEDLGLRIEDVEEKYTPDTHLAPFQEGGEHEGVYPDDIIDYVTDKRVEINSVIVQLDDNRKFWDWILDKLRDHFNNRDYTRSVRTTNQGVIPGCLEELNEIAKEEDAIILESPTDRLDDRLSNIEGGFLFDRTNEVLADKGKEEITIPQYQNMLDEHKKHIIEQHSEMKPYWNKIEEITTELKERKKNRDGGNGNNNNSNNIPPPAASTITTPRPAPVPSPSPPPASKQEQKELTPERRAEIEAAKTVGISIDQYDKCQFLIEHAPESMKKKLERGDMSINEAYNKLRKERNRW